MNLLYLTQVFELAEDAGSDRHYYVCSFAVRVGWSVAAITSNVDYKRAVPKFPRRMFARERVEGVDVRYVYSYSRFRGSFKKRLLYYGTYALFAFIDSLRQKRPDVIYAVSTPLTVGLLGVVLSKIWRRPLVFEVTDLWPDAALAVGVLRPGMAERVARRIERICYREASVIVALTSGIREAIIRHGVSPEKVALITNGFDPSLFASSDPGRSQVRETLELPDEQFCCMYLGAHGRYNSLQTVLDAAVDLRDDTGVTFVLVGDGDEKVRLERFANENELKNVRFLPPVPRRESIAVLQAADAFVLPNRSGDFFRMNLPNKLFDFLGSKRPIVVAGDGETGDVVRAAGAGLVVGAEDGKAMADAIRKLRSMSDSEREAVGVAGYRYAVANFSRQKLAEKSVRLLEQIADGHGSLMGRDGR
jgi:glycosyltransferase involved in cell wall biosynthesis